MRRCGIQDPGSTQYNGAQYKYPPPDRPICAEGALLSLEILKLQEEVSGPAMHIMQCADSGYHTPLIVTEATKCSGVVAIIESARQRRVGGGHNTLR